MALKFQWCFTFECPLYTRHLRHGHVAGVPVRYSNQVDIVPTKIQRCVFESYRVHARARRGGFLHKETSSGKRESVR